MHLIREMEGDTGVPELECATGVAHPPPLRYTTREELGEGGKNEREGEENREKKREGIERERERERGRRGKRRKRRKRRKR